jgi:hypothetical protein
MPLMLVVAVMTDSLRHFMAFPIYFV